MSKEHGPATESETKMTSLSPRHALKGVLAGDEALGLKSLRLRKSHKGQHAAGLESIAHLGTGPAADESPRRWRQRCSL